jgi:Ca2+-binding RTX toxin-like protein
MATISGTVDGEQLYDLPGSQSDQINGLGGDDVIFMSQDNGNDVVDGGSGNDIVSYYYSFSAGYGITIDLGTGSADDGFGHVDTLVSIEVAQGTRFADEMWGSDIGNTLWGGDGDDLLYGQDGNDQLAGENGADLMDGGATGMTLSNISKPRQALQCHLRAELVRAAQREATRSSV